MHLHILLNKCTICIFLKNCSLERERERERERDLSLSFTHIYTLNHLVIFIMPKGVIVSKYLDASVQIMDGIVADILFAFLPLKIRIAYGYVFVIKLFKETL